MSALESPLVFASPGRELVWVVAGDFTSVRDKGRWGAEGFTIGELSDLDPVTDANEALKLSSEARAASTRPVRLSPTELAQRIADNLNRRVREQDEADARRPG